MDLLNKHYTSQQLLQDESKTWDISPQYIFLLLGLSCNFLFQIMLREPILLTELLIAYIQNLLELNLLFCLIQKFASRLDDLRVAEVEQKGECGLKV